MADLGNLWYTLGLKDDVFRQKMQENTNLLLEFDRILTASLGKMGGTKLANTTALQMQKVQDSAANAEAKRTQLAETGAARRTAIEAQAAARIAAINSKMVAQQERDALKLQKLQQSVANGGMGIGSGAGAKAVMSMNGHLSITKRLVGEIGSLAAMYFSVFTAGRIIESLIRIRGEFDMQLISLKAILQSGEQATKLFNQIKGLAVISPFKFMDLTTYAKQLSAYQIPTSELFDTTKRLADLSAGLGVDMNRIILAYGQVRSAAFLRGQELRQFTEAGIPMVNALADKFTKLEGRVVSTGDVFEKISKREVPFEMVKQVIEDLTNEGGKFYMMQEKQAESLKGKVSNLADQYDIMMNRIGEANDGLLKGGVDSVTWLMQNSQTLLNILSTIAVTMGTVKLAQFTMTSGIGKQTNAKVGTAESAQKEYTNQLRLAQAYRQLNEAEQGQANAVNRLTYARVKQLAVSGQLNKDELLRLVYTGKITKAQAGHLVQLGKLTKEEVNFALAQRSSFDFGRAEKFFNRFGLSSEKMNNGLARMVLGVRKFGQAIGGAMSAVFNPANVLVMALSGIFMVIEHFSEKSEEMEKNVKQTVDDAKSTYDDLQKFLNDNPIEIAVTEPDIKKMVEKYEQEIKDASPLYIPIIATGESIAAGKQSFTPNTKEPNNVLTGMEGQLAYYRKQLQDLAAAKAAVAANGSLFENAEDKTNGWFDDAASQNVKEATNDLDNLNTSLAAIKKEDYAQAFAEMEKLGGKDAERAKQLSAEFDALSKSGATAFTIFKKMREGGLGGVLPTSNIGKAEDMFNKVYGADNLNGFSDNKGSLKTAQDDIKEFADFVKQQGIDVNTDIGRMQVEVYKQTYFQTKEYSDSMKDLFNLGFDAESGAKVSVEAVTQLIGNSIATEHKDLMQKLISGDITDAEIEQLKKVGAAAKNELEQRMPEYRDLIERTYGTIDIVANLRVMWNAQPQIEQWKKDIDASLGAVYDKAGNLKGKHSPFWNIIQAGTDPEETIKSVLEARKKAQQSLDKEGKVMIKVGVDTSEISGNSLWDKIKGKLSQWFGGGGGGSLFDKLLGTKKENEEKVKASDKFANLFYPYGDDSKSGKSGTGGGSQKDTFTEELKARYEKIKDAIAKYNELVKTLGEKQAKEEIRKLFPDVSVERYYNDNGSLNLIHDIYSRVLGRKTEAAKSLRETLDKAFGDEAIKQITDKLKEFEDRLSSELKLGKENFSLYDKLFEKTGDSGFSARFSFGENEKKYTDYIDQLEASILKYLERTGNKGVTISDLLHFDTSKGASIKNTYGDVVDKMVNELQEAISGKKASIAEKVANALYDTASIADKIKIRQEQLKKDLADYVAAGGKEFDNGWKALVAAAQADYNKYNEELFQLTPAYDAIFGDMTYRSYGQVKGASNLASEIVNNSTVTKKNGKAVSFSSFYMENGEQKKVYGTISLLDKLRKAVDQFKTLEQKNPFKALGDAFKQLLSDSSKNDKLAKSANALGKAFGIKGAGKATASSFDKLTGASKEKIKDQYELAAAIGDVADIAGNAAKSFSNMFDALGNDGAASVMESVSQVLGGMNKIADGFANGGPVGAAVASIGVVADLVTSAAKKHDEALQKVIEQSKLEVTKLENLRAELSKEIERSLGGAYTMDISSRLKSESDRLEQIKLQISQINRDSADSAKGTILSIMGINDEYDNLIARKRAFEQGGVYGYEKQLLIEEKAEKEKEMEAESKKKKKDKSAIEDYKKDIADLDDQINNFGEDLAKSLYGVDFKSWASELSDAVVEAWINGEDAADAYNKKVSDIMKDMVKKWVSNKMFEVAFKNVEKKYFNEDNGIFSQKYDFDKATLAQFSKDVNDAGKTAVNGTIALLDSLKAGGMDFTSETTSGLSGSIKNITEDTADLLASYMNAMRADLAYIRNYYAAKYNNISAQTDIITNISVRTAEIAANTRRNADTADALYQWANSITVSGANGKKLRI